MFTNLNRVGPFPWYWLWDFLIFSDNKIKKGEKNTFARFGYSKFFLGTISETPVRIIKLDKRTNYFFVTHCLCSCNLLSFLYQPICNGSLGRIENVSQIEEGIRTGS